MAKKGLFDHIKAITNEQNPKYWDTLEESDKKTWSNYMIIRYMTMNPDWVELIAEIQPYLQEAPPKAVYKALIGLLPKSRTFLKYMKAASSENYEDWLVKLVAKFYEVSQTESEQYLKILYSTKSGKEHIKEIAEMYGTDPKIITKLKLGI
jgi:hypothetical protein